jgi:trimethylamine:corrinoid methyltransferase-like protein
MTIKRHPLPEGAPVRCFELAHEAGATVALRVELTDRLVSLPLDQLRRWTLHREDPERLVLLVGENLAVIATGAALREVHEALDRGRLAVLRCAPERRSQEPWIKSIELLDRARDAPKR